MENSSELRSIISELIAGGVTGKSAVGGCIVEYHDTLSSTQVRAKELAGEGVKRALVIAGEQSAGRGRAARRWESPKGSGLYFSVLFRPALPKGSAHMVNAAAALSVAGAVRSLPGPELQLKWPNDLLISSACGYRKVCGILSESALRGESLDYCITGIGLNLYPPPGLPPDLKDRVGWLWGEGKINRAELLSLIVEKFFNWIHIMEREGVEHVLSAYRERCASVGRVVVVETDSETLTGLCAGIGNDGELLVETPEGTRRFHVADVTHARLE